jgi:regulator of extracellular matrix RemA (YlzA/DUF370 family)
MVELVVLQTQRLVQHLMVMSLLLILSHLLVGVGVVTGARLVEMVRLAVVRVVTLLEIVEVRDRELLVKVMLVALLVLVAELLAEVAVAVLTNQVLPVKRTLQAMEVRGLIHIQYGQQQQVLVITDTTLVGVGVLDILLIPQVLVDLAVAVMVQLWTEHPHLD